MPNQSLFATLSRNTILPLLLGSLLLGPVWKTSAANPPAGGDVVFIDSAVEDSALLGVHLQPDAEVVLLRADEDAVAQMQRHLAGRHGLRAIRLISHATPGSLFLSGSLWDAKRVQFHAEAFRSMGQALKPDGDFLLYGCDLAANESGRELVQEIALLTGANVAASTNRTGAAALGGDWVLECQFGPVSAGPVLQAGYDYAGVLPAPIVGVDPTFNTVYVRPGGISNTWVFGPFNSSGNASVGIPDGPATVNHLTYFDSSPDILNRGKFQYTTDGTNWIDFPHGTFPGPTIAGKTYRFVDLTPGDTTTNDSCWTAWDYVLYGASTSTGQNIIVDNPPTDVFPIALDYWGSPATGEDMVGLSKTDTGNTSGGVYAIDTQSVASLFAISGTKLVRGTGALPAVGTGANVTLRYYDYYQTDNTGAPIAGQGITRAVTLTRRSNPSGFGSDLHVNTFQTNTQSNAQVAGLSDGSFVVVWRSTGQDGETTSSGGIYAQKYSAAGVASGSEFALSTAGNGVNESNPSVAALSGGRFVIVYQQANTDNDIIYRIVAANGTVGAETLAPSSATGAQTAPSVATLPNGNFAIAWIAPNGADTGDVWVRQFNGTTGAAVASSELVVNTTQANTQSLPTVAPLSNNNYAVSWRDSANSGDVLARVMGTTAAVSGEVVVINTATAQNNPRCAALTGGGFVVVYSDAGQTEGSLVDTSSQSNIYAQRYDNSGAAQGSRFLVNAGTTFNQTTPAIATLSGGGFIVSWQSNTDPDGTGGLFARRFTAAGTAVDSYDFQLNERRIDTQSASVLAGLASDSFATAWSDNTLDGTSNTGVGARVFTAAVIPPNLSINDVAIGEGNAGTTNFTFTVSLSAAAPTGGVTFDIATADGTATTATNDYVAKSLTSQTIPAGSNSYSFTVLVNGDTSIEPNETFFVNVTNVTNATVTDGQGQGTINNDDVATAPTVTTPTSASVTSFSATLGGNVTSDGGAAITARGVVFAKTAQNSNPQIGGANVTNQTATGTTGVFTVNAASLTPGTQYSFAAYATNSVGTTYTTPVSTFTTVALPNLSINDVSLSEGDSGTTSFNFTVSLSSAAPAGGVTFDIATANGTATSGGGDYTAQSLTSQTIPAGNNTYTFTVLVNGDASFEPNETFFVNVTNVTNAIVTDGQGSGTINNDDPAVADLSITKTDGVTTAIPGNSVTYTITVTNAGPDAATGVTVADTFPAILTATWTGVGAGGGTGPASGSGNISTSAVNLPAGGSFTFTAVAAISPAATGTLSNTATVAAPGSVNDPNAANNSATDTDTLTPQANLAITKTDGVTTATPGGSVTYTITASNAGPSNASGATVADTLPASLTATWTAVGAGGGTATASGSGNINDIVNLPAGGSVTYTVSATISPSATGTPPAASPTRRPATTAPPIPTPSHLRPTSPSP